MKVSALYLSGGEEESVESLLLTEIKIISEKSIYNKPGLPDLPPFLPLPPQLALLKNKNVEIYRQTQ